MQHCTRCDGARPRRSEDCLRPCTLKSGDSCDACTLLKTLDDDLDEAEKRVEELRQRREKLLTTAVNASHDLLVRMLPTEIIVMIFESYLASHECVLSLGRICQAWRRIAWGTPKLWAHIAIELQPSSLADDLYFLTTYITRSGTLPLSISLYAKAIESASLLPYYPPYFPFLDALKRCSHRWKSLELEFPCQLLDYFRISHDGAFPNAPILQELAIYPIYGSDASWDEGSFSLGPNKPSPAKMTFGQMSPKRIDVDWSRVSEVEVTGIYLHEAFELLECGQNMDRCDVEIEYPDSDFSFLSALSTTATTHRLRTLRFAMGCLQEENILLFFASVTLPCLEYLEIAGIYKSSPLVDTLISFLGRSSCPLTSLDIGQLSPSGKDDLARLLKATPMLKELGAHLLPLACLDPLLEVLNEKTEDTLGYRFVPLLDTLNLKGIVSSWDPVVALCLQEDCDQSRKRPLSVVNVTGPDLKEGQHPPALTREALPPAFLLTGGGTSIHFDGKYSGRTVFS